MTKEEELLCMLRKLNAISRRSKHEHDEQPPPPPPPSEGEDRMPPPPPPREHGRVRLMNMLKGAGEMSQRDIAERLEIRPQSLSELLVKMETEGFITRRQDENDKRISMVSLTSKGEEQLTIMQKANKEHAEMLFSPLSDREKDELAVILKKLTEQKKEN
jgi:DNA-binding MarR family transcriptional regulator